MRTLALALLLATLTGSLAADGAVDEHWVLRAQAAGLREASATVPVYGFVFPGIRYLGRAPLTQNEWDSAGQASVRNYGALGLTDLTRVEWNLLATAQGATADFTPTAQPLGRSAVLERRIYDEAGRRVDASVDQLNLRWQSESLALVAGRHAVFERRHGPIAEKFLLSPRANGGVFCER